jgi:hypothetical protein
MSVNMVDTLKANKDEYEIRPAVDGNARIAYSAAELEQLETFRLKAVDAAFEPEDKPGMWVGHFGDIDLEKHADSRWEIAFTPHRFTLWSPKSVGTFFVNKPKEKPGIATGGQVKYEWIDDIFAERSLCLSFLFVSDPKSKPRITKRILEVYFRNAEEAAAISAALADRIEGLWRTAGDVPEALVSVLDELRQYDWTAYKPLKLSMLKAGAKVKYTP